MFSLFGKYSREYSDHSHGKRSISGIIINNDYNNFECCVQFMSNNIKYSIIRTGKRQATKKDYLFDTIKNYQCSFYKYDNNDNKINLSEFTVYDTQQKINQIIGTYDDFCLSTVCFQNNSKIDTDFFEMDVKNRKQFLDKLLKLDIFNNVEQKYKDKLSLNKKEIYILTNSYDYKNYDSDTPQNIIDLKNIIDNYDLSNDEELLKSYKLELNDVRKKILPLNPKYKEYAIKNLSKFLKKLPNNFDIQEIKIINNDLQKKIKNVYLDDLQKTHIDDKIKLIQDKINSLKYVHNKDTIIESNKLFELTKKNKISKLRSQITNNKMLHNYISNDIIESLQDIHDNINISDYTANINNYNEQLYNIKLLYTETEIKLNNMKKYINFDMIMTDKLKVKYSKISNWNLYVQGTNSLLENYEHIHNTYLIMKSNKEVIKIFDDFSKCINKDCSNCCNHLQNIQTFYTNNNIINGFDNIKTKYKKVFDIFNNHNLIIKYNQFNN